MPVAPAVDVANVTDTAASTTTYRYRNAGARREYMRALIRKRRAAARA